MYPVVSDLTRFFFFFVLELMFCLESYDKLLAIDAILQERLFRWCKCGNGQIHLPGGIPTQLPTTFKLKN